MIYKGNHKLGDFFTSRRERGTPGLPMLSVTMNNGVVTRESLDRKMETNLSDEEHLLVRKDDIVYNMMRMWQGASGLSDRDGLLSPAYVVLAPKKGIDPLYASYLFKSSRLIYLLWAYSYGLTSDRLRLYFNDFKRIPVNIPSLPEQRKIGKTLSTWDKAIEITEKLIDNSKAQKTTLMRQLLNGHERYSEYRYVWKYAKFDDLFKVANNKKVQIKSSDYLEKGLNPIVDQGQKMIAGYTNSDSIYSDVPVIIFGDHTRVVKWIDFPFALGADGTQIIKIKSSINLKFGYYLLVNTDLPSLGYSRHMRELKEKDFKYPVDPEAQQNIVQIITAADREIETLQQKLACLKQEKKALMQQLLTGKRRVKVDQS